MIKTRSASDDRLLIVDAARGIASLAVCLFHLTNGNAGFLPSGFLKSAGSYGWLGVEVFFVISGFIIPYSLHRAGYDLRNFGTFLLKRMVRLDPPYIVTIILIIVFNSFAAMAPGFRGTPFIVSLPQVVLHLAYLNVFFGYEWLNPIFWTLAIEFQYYLLIGLLFPLIAHQHYIFRGGAFGLLLALMFILPDGTFVFHWLALFMMGMLAFQLRAELVCRQEYFVWLAMLIIGSGCTLGLLITITGTITAIMLTWASFGGGNLLLFFGKISYSLYLIHVLVGMKIVNLGNRLATGLPGKLLVLAGALVASIVAAYALYQLVERPAQKWSSAIRFRRVSSTPVVAATQDA